MVDDCDVSQVTISELLLLVFPHPQHRQKSLLRNIDFPDPLHPLFAFLLLLQKLAFSRDIAAIALGEDVLA